MPLLAVTVIGSDRPGIIAAVTGALADLGGNLEDSTMTLLRGHFAMTLVLAGPAAVADVERVLAPVAQRLDVVTTVAEVVEELPAAPVGPHVVLSVHGADRPGIVSRLTSVVARHGGNVTDLTTRLSGELYVVVADIDLPGDSVRAELETDLRAVADELGVDAVLHDADADLL